MSDSEKTIDVFGEDSPFELCENCGRVINKPYVHYCPLDDEEQPLKMGDSREAKERRLEADDYPSDEPVIFAAGGHSFTYHLPADPDDDESTDVDPNCRARFDDTNPRHTERRRLRMARAEARERGLAPCSFCHGLDAQKIQFEKKRAEKEAADE